MENEQLDGIGAREENEWRIFGPPGCGKTTHASRQISRAVQKYGPEGVLVTSFSRGAAAELVARDLPIPRNQIGTLHAHCYRALDRPTIAETKIADWNDQNPYWAVAQARENDMDEAADERAGGSKDGDRLLAAANRYRNRKMIPETWPDQGARQFFDLWCEWKRDNDLMDFTDLLETAERDCKIAPGDPRVLLADEAQDFTRLQLGLVRKWGRHAEYFIIVGDDDQTIYSFTGATPDAFLTPEIAREQKIVLSQSYRVPIAIHAKATAWIQQVERREPKEYRPTKEPGLIEHVQIPFASPRTLVLTAEREAAEGRTSMFLASCSYMLDPIRRELQERAIPFHNPYRRRRYDWNPLYCANGTPAAARVLAFGKPHNEMGNAAQPWTAADYIKWAAWITAKGVFTPGGKTAAKDLPDQATITIEHLREWLEPEAYDAILQNIMSEPIETHLRWWAEHVLSTHKKTASYPVNVALRQGMDGLRQSPKIIIGTIHSVKGGEADTVYLTPDISYPAQLNWEKGGGEGFDSIIRQFYVGMTRARRRLVICAPSGQFSVHI